MNKKQTQENAHKIQKALGSWSDEATDPVFWGVFSETLDAEVGFTHYKDVDYPFYIADIHFKTIFDLIVAISCIRAIRDNEV
ncbi:unnamed protein product [marine sediment metagenome]|uniref:Uncharacterized protein n=1 Tax=marine sediment metagenome TaxID=412755 RepID=X1DMG2_9ZZZZ